VSETIRYILTSLGVIALFFTGIFVASFVAWWIGKRKDEE